MRIDTQAPTHAPSTHTVTDPTDVLLARSRAGVIGVVGTSGKSTTAALVSSMLRSAGLRVETDLHAAIERADRLTSRDRVVLELHSPLDVRRIGVSLLAVTGLVADELPAGSTMAGMTSALRLAARVPRSAVVVNGSDSQAVAATSATRIPLHYATAHDPKAAATLIEEHIVVRDAGVPRRVCTLDEARGNGLLVVQNVLVAAATAVAAGARASDVRRGVLGHVQALDNHSRVAAGDEVVWVSDAAADKPGRAAAVLEAYAGPVILIAGGPHAGLPLMRWARAVHGHASAPCYMARAPARWPTRLRPWAPPATSCGVRASMTRCTSRPYWPCPATRCCSRRAAPPGTIATGDTGSALSRRSREQRRQHDGRGRRGAARGAAPIGRRHPVERRRRLALARPVDHVHVQLQPRQHVLPRRGALREAPARLVGARRLGGGHRARGGLPLVASLFGAHHGRHPARAHGPSRRRRLALRRGALDADRRLHPAQRAGQAGGDHLHRRLAVQQARRHPRRHAGPRYRSRS